VHNENPPAYPSPVNGALLVLAGAGVAVLAFPRFGPGWLILPGITLFLAGLRMATNRRQGLLYGAIYGLVYFSALLWWIGELGLIALAPLVIVQAAFPAMYGWWLTKYNERDPSVWFLLTVGGWALMELTRYHFPFSGFEWGAAGYALSDQAWARTVAPLIGVSGLMVVIVAVGAALALFVQGKRERWLWLTPASLAPLLAAALVWNLPTPGYTPSLTAAIVQGSTPCPYERCPPDERLRTYQQHLALTREIEPGSVDLVVWSEGSTGSSNADPVQNPEIGEAIAAEARRIGAWILVGSDRPLDETHWVNANVVFNPQGDLVGEYEKQHPVPFGEYIPFRPLFEWIPDLDQVPRDMIPGDGPVVFDLGDVGGPGPSRLGSVISFEGSFARYPRQHVVAGASFLVVATNEGSYGTTPGSDQLIAMTRMRAAELGTPVIHSAVTGKSVFIDESGAFTSEATGLGTTEILTATVNPSSRSIYAQTGDVLLILAALVGLGIWWRARSLVGSDDRKLEEE
jgi:apolipoprotein N-acyltransferase